jgi:mannan endo-1,4-beta-mannosidase
MKATLTFALGLLASAVLADEPPRPVNPSATREARQLLDFLYAVQGKHTLSGQHNFIVSGSRFSDRIRELTGKTPLIWGSDFSFAYQGDAPMRFQHCGPLNLTEPGTKAELTGLAPEAARERWWRTRSRRIATARS